MNTRTRLAPRPGHCAVAAHGARRSNAWWPGLPAASSHARPALGCIELPADGATHDESEVADLRLSLATTPEQIERVVELRQAAYGRHGYPALPGDEWQDRSRGAAVLLVEDGAGEAIATMRSCMGVDGPIPWSQGIELPASFADRRIAYFERLAVRRADRRVVPAKQMLFKAAWLLAMSCAIDVAVVATISPLDRLFADIGFDNVFGPGQTRRVSWHPAEFNVMQMELDSLAGMCLRSNPAWYFHCTTPDPHIESLVQAFHDGLATGRSTRSAGGRAGGRSAAHAHIGSIV